MSGNNGKQREKSLNTSDWDTALGKVNQMVLTGDMEPARPAKTVVAAIDEYFVEEASRGIQDSTRKSFHKFLDGNHGDSSAINGLTSPLLP
jgi:hypothetical protein